MSSAIHKSMFLTATLTIVLVTVLGVSAVAAAVVNPHALSTAHGGGFLIKSQVDPNFCIDVAAGTTQGRALSLSACVPQYENELWTFTRNSDGSNLLVDTQGGMCVDTAGRIVGDGIALKVRNCSFANSQRFQFTSVGRIQVSGTTKCVSIPRANAGAAVFLQTCNSSTPGELFKLG